MTEVQMLLPVVGDARYSLRRSRRRTIAIHVSIAGVEVRAPLRAAQRDIDAFVREKSLWIDKKLAELREHDVEMLSIGDGAGISVMGDMLVVHWQPAVRNGVQRDGDVLRIEGRALNGEKARRLFLRWLLAEAERSLLPFAQQRIAEMGLSQRLRGFSLRYTRSLWGRCSASGDILFNPLVMLAAPSVVDYLVVHEASHLRHMDHSPAFWSLVASHCPDWQHSRRWLREHGHRLRVA